MSHQLRLQRLPTTTANQFVDVKLRYDLGGINFATYQPKPRGYYLSIQPITVEGGFEKFVAFTGQACCVEKAERFNRRRFDTLAELHQTSEIRNRMLEAVLASQNLTLAAETTPQRQELFA